RQLYALESKEARINAVSKNGLSVIITQQDNKQAFNVAEKLKNNDLDFAITQFNNMATNLSFFANSSIMQVEPSEKEGLLNLYISDKDGRNKNLILEETDFL